MATLTDLQAAKAANSTLRVQVREAVHVAAQTIIDEAPGTVNHADRLTWAKRVLPCPDSELERVLAYVIAKNSAASLAQITGATDAAVQAAVNGAVNALAP